MIKKSALIPLLAISVSLTFGNAYAAVDMFLKIEGIDGESTDDKHKDEIDVESWSWGASHTGSSSADAVDISIMKHIDKATPLLMSHVLKGTHIEEATLTFQKSGAEPFEFLKYTLKDVLITSSTTSGTSADNPTELVTLQFGIIETKYIPQDETGRPLPAVTFCWNFEEDVGCVVTPEPDSDGDGIPDDQDVCPGFDDAADSDGDGVPDGCDFVPTATADSDLTSGIAPLFVSFTCEVTGGNAPLAFMWTFGDGTSSTLQNPTHTYLEPGSYTATCTATDTDDDLSSDSVEVTVIEDLVPQVSISATPLSGIEPLEVQFSASASGGNGQLIFEWDFDGDGINDSTQQNPVFTYATTGSFSAICTVRDVDGDQAQATQTISVLTIGQAVQQIINEINNMGLNKGMATSLTSNLDEISRIVNDNNINNDNSACGKLGSFINKVKANRSLTLIQKDDLVQQANTIKQAIGC